MKCRTHFYLLLLCLSLPFGSILRGQTSQETCVIQGYVRDKATQQPNANVTVTIQMYTRQSTMTDQNGFFKFENAPKIFCEIQATGPDIYSPRMNIDPSNQDVFNMIIETKPGGKLTGTVTDDQNNPIPNASVNYWQSNNSGTHNTNDKGEFSFSGLDRDSPFSNIAASADGFQPSYINNTEFPAGQNVINLTFQLSSASEDTTNGPVKITISGDVMDSSSNPISNATVANYANPRSSLYRFTITDNNGLFVLKNISFERKDNQIQFKGLAFFACATGYAPAWKQMESAQDTVLHFILPDAHYVAGKVVDSDKNPLGSVVVHYGKTPKLDKAVQNPWNYQLHKMVSTDSEGEFRVDDLPGEGVEFAFIKSNYTPVDDTTLSLDKDDNVVTLIPSVQVTGIVVDDITGKPITSFKVSASRPQNPQQDNSYNSLDHNALTFTPEDGKFTLSNLMFLINDTHVGSYVRVRVQADGYQREEEDMIPVQTPPLKEKDRVVFRMKKAYSFSASGIVVENSTGIPVSNVNVTAQTPINNNMPIPPFFDWEHLGFSDQNYSFLKTTTDANGRFQFKNLSSNAGGIALVKQGYGKSFFSPIEYTQFIQLKLPKAGSITAILGEAAIQSKDTILGFLNQSGAGTNIMYEQKTMNQEGKIIYTDLPPGEFSLFVSRNGTGVNHKVTLQEGQNLVLDLSTSTYIKIYGTVHYKGAPVDNVFIYGNLLDSATVVNAGGHSDKNGKYEMLLTTPGKYGIGFSKWDGRSMSQNTYKTLSVESGKYLFDCNLPDSAIKGLLMNTKTGKPIPQVPISAYQKKRGEDILSKPPHMEYSNPIWSLFKTTTTDDNGQFAMEDMEAGQWLIAEEKAPGIASPSKPFQLTVNQTKDNIVLMEPDKGTLEISVLDEDSGNLVIPIELGCVDSTGYVYQPAYAKNTSPIPNPYISQPIATDSTGKVIFSSIPSGTYKVYARTDAHPTSSTNLEIFSGKTTHTTLKLKKGGRLVFSLKEKKDLSENDSVFCVAKVLRAKEGTPIMQDAIGTYKKTSFFFSMNSQDTCLIPLPAGDYTVQLQINYYSPKNKNFNRTPSTLTRLLKVEQDKDTVWEISIANLKN